MKESQKELFVSMTMTGIASSNASFFGSFNGPRAIYIPYKYRIAEWNHLLYKKRKMIVVQNCTSIDVEETYMNGFCNGTVPYVPY
jgi:hypothetical protein